jgi:peptidoglycan glycosyltransferase
VRKANNVKVFLDAAADKPLLPRAWGEIYPPGSTFKTVTTSIAVDRNVDVDTVFPVVESITLPQTGGQQLFNFGGESCGGTLRESFIESCNTTFAQVGFDLGNQFADGIQNFGVEADPPNSKSSGIDPKIVKSRGPERGTFRFNQPDFMKDAIGQQDVAVTPLQMALVAQSVATGGVVLVPNVVRCVLDPDNRVVKTVGRQEYKRAMSATTAATIRDFMLGVVAEGTGTAAQIPGVLVAGKTGTAETAPGARPHAWFIEFAPADAPQYAVAVLVEHGGQAGGGDSVTGGRVAAPIAKTVMQTLLTTPEAPSPCDGQPTNSGSDG